MEAATTASVGMLPYTQEKRHAEEWWFNFGGEVGGLFFSRKKNRDFFLKP